MIMRTVKNQPRTTQEDLVNDLKAAGVIVTKKTIGNTLRRVGMKSCSAHKVPLLKLAHVQARLKFANDSEENWVNVLWSDETKIELFGINLTRRVWRRRRRSLPMTLRTPPYRQTWRWKDYALGCFSANGTGQLHRIKGTTTRNIWPLWLPTRFLPPSTKSCLESNTYLTHSNQIIFFVVVNILSLTVQINLPLKL